MALGADTVVLNGQRITLPSGAAYAPSAFAQSPISTPIQTVSIPPMVGNGGGANVSGAVTGADVVGGYGTAGLNSAATLDANANPWSPRSAPTVWVIGGLAVGLLVLSKVHWSKTAVGVGEHAEAGPVHESGEAGA